MSAFRKDFFRTIAQAPGRFLALLAIVALGAGFYAGLRMTAPDMDAALDEYFDGGHVYDVRVVSTMGLEEADLEGFVEKLEGYYPEVRYVNRLMTHSWGQKVIRFYDPDGNLIEVGTPV